MPLTPVDAPEGTTTAATAVGSPRGEGAFELGRETVPLLFAAGASVTAVVPLTAAA